MSYEERIQQNVRELQTELGDDYWQTSAAELTLLPAIEAALERHAGGRLLDAGAGRLLYEPILRPHCDEYESLDVAPAPGLDYHQDVQNTTLPSETYDTVFCRHVLEHVPRPGRAIEEIHRVLKPGGTAILTVPHLAYLHNEPEDYYRFTGYGIEGLVEDAGFEDVHVEAVGGLFSFLGYSLATLLLGVTYHLPLVSSVALSANAVVQRALVSLDGISGSERYFPFNYIVIATK